MFFGRRRSGKIWIDLDIDWILGIRDTTAYLHYKALNIVIILNLGVIYCRNFANVQVG